MADDSVLPSPSEITSLADSSVFDSKVAEMSKENLCLASTSNVDEEMPQVEARVIMVQDAGKQEELLKALKEMKVPCVKMDSMEEFESLDSPEFENIFVVTDFQNSAPRRRPVPRLTPSSLKVDL